MGWVEVGGVGWGGWGLGLVGGVGWGGGGGGWLGGGGVGENCSKQCFNTELMDFKIFQKILLVEYKHFGSFWAIHSGSEISAFFNRDSLNIFHNIVLVRIPLAA